MATNRQLKIDLLKEQTDFARQIQSILSSLAALDAKASLLPMEKAIASRTLVKKLWDLLPEEYESYYLADEENLTDALIKYLPTVSLSQNVTLHLGWDVLSFSCTLEAAWFGWRNYNSISIDTFNSCIYPDSLDWYIIRAGNNFYPMYFNGKKFVLTTK